MLCTDKRRSQWRVRLWAGCLALAQVTAAMAAPAPGPAALDGSAAPEWSAEFVAQVLADARTNGDARRGAGVFNVAATGCTACHKVAGQRASSAPQSVQQ
jgi:hypothetical protein